MRVWGFTCEKSPKAIAGPIVRAGFIDPPVYGPSCLGR